MDEHEVHQEDFLTPIDDETITLRRIDMALRAALVWEGSDWGSPQHVWHAVHEAVRAIGQRDEALKEVRRLKAERARLRSALEAVAESTAKKWGGMWSTKSKMESFLALLLIEGYTSPRDFIHLARKVSTAFLEGEKLNEDFAFCVDPPLSDLIGLASHVAVEYLGLEEAA